MRQNSGAIRKLLAGFLIGIGCILPGVSGGVMAVSFGLYRPMLDAVLGFFREPRRHGRFLFPLAVGGLAGMLLGAKGLAAALALYETQTLFLFTGFILGGLPALLREAEQNGRFRMIWLCSLLGGIALALPMLLFNGQTAALERLSPIQALVTGLLEGIGTVVPGISTSFILLRLGWYQAYLSAVSGADVHVLVPVLLGFALSALTCMRTVQWLFQHHTGHACYAVLGFVLVSVALVFPGFSSGRTLWAECGLLVIGAVLAGWLEQTDEQANSSEGVRT